MSPEMKALVIKAFSEHYSVPVQQAVEQHPELALQCLLEEIASESSIRNSDVWRCVLRTGNYLRKLVEEGNGQARQEAAGTETSI